MRPPLFLVHLSSIFLFEQLPLIFEMAVLYRKCIYLALRSFEGPVRHTDYTYIRVVLAWQIQPHTGRSRRLNADADGKWGTCLVSRMHIPAFWSSQSREMTALKEGWVDMILCAARVMVTIKGSQGHRGNFHVIHVKRTYRSKQPSTTSISPENLPRKSASCLLLPLIAPPLLS